MAHDAWTNKSPRKVAKTSGSVWQQEVDGAWWIIAGCCALLALMLYAGWY
jgi:hypothetical protein